MSAATTQAASSPTEIQSLVSPDGVEAWRVESDFVPLVAVAFAFEGGAPQDPPGKGGAAGRVTRAQVREIAEKKIVDLNCATVESAMAMIEGSARSMGLEVVG